ncbi:GntR family transcriptional regulator [Neomicrococcus aestuarii]|uniref:GntR family transcriptional regulator n=1 Tax=Neomicrococcus aestuarii TaxID=556325 RepID=A0A1L2ZPW2_9MICC|nr:GntR family transcriptional regulator [Neomicrococcus aestuarii]APF41051.1 GntR family transcriptional regulator [Neomicrococcus aestuarii]
MVAANVLGSIAKGSAEHAHTSAWIVSVLRKRISEGKLTPGSKLSEQALSEALGVSRNTLREAFAILSNESIITRIPNRGVFVARPSVEDIREIYRVRRMLEPAAILWASPTPAQIKRLHEIIASARTARDAGASGSMATANQRLHQELVAMCGSPTLDTVMEQVLAQMRLVFHAMAETPDFHAQFVERNAALVQDIVDGKREEAAASLREYLVDAEAVLLEHVAAE